MSQNHPTPSTRGRHPRRQVSSIGNEVSPSKYAAPGSSPIKISRLGSSSSSMHARSSSSNGGSSHLNSPVTNAHLERNASDGGPSKPRSTLPPSSSPSSQHVQRILLHQRRIQSKAPASTTPISLAKKRVSATSSSPLLLEMPRSNLPNDLIGSVKLQPGLYRSDELDSILKRAAAAVAAVDTQMTTETETETASTMEETGQQAKNATVDSQEYVLVVKRAADFVLGRQATPTLGGPQTSNGVIAIEKQKPAATAFDQSKTSGGFPSSDPPSERDSALDLFSSGLKRRATAGSALSHMDKTAAPSRGGGLMAQNEDSERTGSDCSDQDEGRMRREKSLITIQLPAEAKHVSRVHAKVEWVPFAGSSSDVVVGQQNGSASMSGGSWIVRVLGQNGLIVDGKRRRSGVNLRVQSVAQIPLAAFNCVDVEAAKAKGLDLSKYNVATESHSQTTAMDFFGIHVRIVELVRSSRKQSKATDDSQPASAPSQPSATAAEVEGALNSLDQGKQSVLSPVQPQSVNAASFARERSASFMHSPSKAKDTEDHAFAPSSPSPMPPSIRSRASTGKDLTAGASPDEPLLQPGAAESTNSPLPSVASKEEVLLRQTLFGSMAPPSSAATTPKPRTATQNGMGNEKKRQSSSLRESFLGKSSPLVSVVTVQKKRISVPSQRQRSHSSTGGNALNQSNGVDGTKMQTTASPRPASQLRDHSDEEMIVPDSLPPTPVERTEAMHAGNDSSASSESSSSSEEEDEQDVTRRSPLSHTHRGARRIVEESSSSGSEEESDDDATEDEIERAVRNALSKQPALTSAPSTHRQAFGSQLPKTAKRSRSVSDSDAQNDDDDLSPPPSPELPPARKKRSPNVPTARAGVSAAKLTESQARMPPPPLPSRRSPPSAGISVERVQTARERARRAVRMLATTYDLEGLLAGTIVFHRTATMAASEAVRGVLATNPGLLQGRAGDHVAIHSSPQKRQALSRAAQDLAGCPEVVKSADALVHGQIAPLWANPSAETLDESRWTTVQRKAWMEHLLLLLRESPMFGSIDRAGKDSSGNALEAWYYYDHEADHDRERATNLKPFVKPIRGALKTLKPIIWKKSLYGRAEDGETQRGAAAAGRADGSSLSAAIPIWDETQPEERESTWDKEGDQDFAL